MPKKHMTTERPTGEGVTTPRKGREPAVVTQAGKTARGEVWRITRDGHEKTVVTVPSSAAALDETTARYKAVLRRLAKK